MVLHSTPMRKKDEAMKHYLIYSILIPQNKILFITRATTTRTNLNKSTFETPHNKIDFVEVTN